MNRTIKFRGKRETDGEWIYGDFFRNRGLSFISTDGIVENPLATWRDYNVRPETVGQFTGLYDKNGYEIYEGDIMMCVGKREDNKGRKYLREVSFKNGSFCMKAPEYNVDSYFYNHMVNGELYWEVVGNIYENKELLEETK